MKRFLLFLFIVGILYADSGPAQWCNLQWPPTASINQGDSVNAYAQIWIDGVTNSNNDGEYIGAWIGINSENTDPSTWSEDCWKVASFNSNVGNNDEFFSAIGSNLSPGTFYYASRFQYQPETIAKNSNRTSVDYPMIYGGTGGLWNNDNGVLTVNSLPTIGWANLQWPPTATIMEGNTATVYAQVWVDGVTNVGSPGANIGAWIGISSENTNPASWDTSAWTPAVFNGDVGNNDEFRLDIGSALTEGTYYYASRFQNSNGPYYYGGYSGGAWDSVNNVSGILTVNALPDTVIDWANLQWPPKIDLINKLTFTVYGQVYEAGVTDDTGRGLGIEAWFGMSRNDTDPSTWSDSAWQVADYNVDVGNNDEYMSTLNIADFLRVGDELILTPGPFYYAARYRLNGGEYFYGGYQGGFWDGINNVNGQGNFEYNSIGSVGWCNLQWPPTININQGESETVYAQLWINGITKEEGPTEGIQVFIGVHNENTDPNTWPPEAWTPASFNTDVGNNDEYMANIGANLEPGTYYYASRFSASGVKSFYGGYNAGGGGFWDGAKNVSGILTISSNEGPAVDWCNLQWPPEGNIKEGDEYMVYAQVWKENITNLEGATPGLSAWIGVNTENTNPAEWNDNTWHQAQFNVDAGNNDEFMFDLGSVLTAGTYYYTSRFQLEDGFYSFGGYNAEGGGFWNGTSNVSGTVIVDPVTSVDEEIPIEYALEQNYPNPFNPSTKIRFSIPSQSDVTLQIFNIMGQEVGMLSSGLVQAGIHEVQWDASNLASGIYVVKIKAVSNEGNKNFIDMKKMILLK